MSLTALVCLALLCANDIHGLGSPEPSTRVASEVRLRANGYWATLILNRSWADPERRRRAKRIVESYRTYRGVVPVAATLLGQRPKEIWTMDAGPQKLRVVFRIHLYPDGGWDGLYRWAADQPRWGGRPYEGDADVEQAAMLGFFHELLDYGVPGSVVELIGRYLKSVEESWLRE